MFSRIFARSGITEVGMKPNSYLGKPKREQAPCGASVRMGKLLLHQRDCPHCCQMKIATPPMIRT